MEKQLIPAGYKQTEVGVIPDDWDVNDIGYFNPFVTSGSRGWANYYSSVGSLFVRITNMRRSSIYLDLTNNKYVSLPLLSAEGKRTELQNDDVLISITADVGISGYVDDSVEKPAYINQHIALVRFTDDKIYSKFVSYYLASENIQKLFRGSTDQGAKAGMNLTAIRAIKFAVPTKPEQTAIANALTDVDALIAALEKLINKKSAIKTAAMQQLLTGKKRLPPYDQLNTGYKQTELGEIPGDWEVKNIGSLCSYQNGTTQEKYFNQHDGYTVISIGNYSEYGKFVDTGNYIDRGFESIVKKFVLKKDDLAMILNDKTAIGTIIGRVLLCDADDKYVINQRSMRLTTNGIVTAKYLHFLINSDLIHKNIVGMAKPGTQIYINTDDVLGLNLLFPKDPEEQTAIANVLSDMDKDIETLQQRLHKTQQIKQGMMQELLTGKTRLVKTQDIKHA